MLHVRISSQYMPAHSHRKVQCLITSLFFILQYNLGSLCKVGTCKKYSLRETRFSGSQKTSPCEDKRLKDTKNPNFGGRRLTNSLFLKNED